MSKSVNGSRAAQSCDGCAAVWTTSSPVRAGMVLVFDGLDERPPARRLV
jgi:hypothetical protein